MKIQKYPLYVKENLNADEYQALFIILLNKFIQLNDHINMAIRRS